MPLTTTNTNKIKNASKKCLNTSLCIHPRFRIKKKRLFCTLLIALFSVANKVNLFSNYSRDVKSII